MPVSSGQDGVCIRCAYDLAGLDAEAVCPECALPVVRSRERSPLLRGADGEWLARLRGGLGDIHRAMSVLFWWVVMVVGLRLAGVAWEVMTGSTPPGRLSWGLEAAVMGVVGIAAAALHIRGCVRAAAGTHADYSAPARARAGLLVCGVLLPVTVGLTLPTFGVMPSLPLWAMLAINGAFQVNALVFFFSLAAVLEHYERRTAGWEETLRKRHRNVRKNLWGVAILVVLGYSQARGGSTWSLVLFGLAYLWMGAAVARVRRAVGEEGK